METLASARPLLSAFVLLIACATADAADVAVMVHASPGHCLGRANPQAKLHALNSGDKLDATDEARCDDGYPGTAKYIENNASFKLTSSWAPIGNASPAAGLPQGASAPNLMGRQASLDESKGVQTADGASSATVDAAIGAAVGAIFGGGSISKFPGRHGTGASATAQPDLGSAQPPPSASIRKQPNLGAAPSPASRAVTE
jgi:hypothetical protein